MRKLLSLFIMLALPFVGSRAKDVVTVNMEYGVYQITLLENGNIIDTCKAIK